MRLIIKQKVFSWGDKFFVTDTNGDIKYIIQGEVFSLGKKLHIYDSDSNEVAFISQKLLSIKPCFLIFRDKIKTAEIVKDFSFFRPSYSIDGLNWKIDGNLLAHKYTIKENGISIAIIDKEFFTWGDSYTLDISDSAEEIIALSVILAIDCILDSSRSSD